MMTGPSAGRSKLTSFGGKEKNKHQSKKPRPARRGRQDRRGGRQGPRNQQGPRQGRQGDRLRGIGFRMPNGPQFRRNRLHRRRSRLQGRHGRPSQRRRVVRDMAHTNGIESFGSNAQAWIPGRLPPDQPGIYSATWTNSRAATASANRIPSTMGAMVGKRLTGNWWPTSVAFIPRNKPSPHQLCQGRTGTVGILAAFRQLSSVLGRRKWQTIHLCSSVLWARFRCLVACCLAVTSR